MGHWRNNSRDEQQQESPMKIALSGLAAVCALVATVQSSAAQESFFNNRYCTQGGRGGSGMMDCSFNTIAQCRAAASGLGRYCVENPNWRGSRHRR
jgi:hypothetical protein